MPRKVWSSRVLHCSSLFACYNCFHDQRGSCFLTVPPTELGCWGGKERQGCILVHQSWPCHCALVWEDSPWWDCPPRYLADREPDVTACLIKMHAPVCSLACTHARTHSFCAWVYDTQVLNNAWYLWDTLMSRCCLQRIDNCVLRKGKSFEDVKFYRRSGPGMRLTIPRLLLFMWHQPRLQWWWASEKNKRRRKSGDQPAWTQDMMSTDRS